jgi:hypothetical protein
MVVSPASAQIKGQYDPIGSFTRSNITTRGANSRDSRPELDSQGGEYFIPLLFRFEVQKVWDNPVRCFVHYNYYNEYIKHPKSYNVTKPQRMYASAVSCTNQQMVVVPFDIEIYTVNSWSISDH